MNYDSEGSYRHRDAIVKIATDIDNQLARTTDTYIIEAQEARIELLKAFMVYAEGK